MYKQDLLERLGIKDRTFVEKYLDTAGLENKDEYSDLEVALLEKIKDRVQDGKESHPAVKQDLQNKRRQQQQQQQGMSQSRTTNPNQPRVTPVVPTGDMGFLSTIVDALNEEQKRQFELAYQFHVATTPHRLFAFMQEKRESGEYTQLMADSLRSFYRSATDAEIRQMYLDSPYVEGDGMYGDSDANKNTTIDTTTVKGYLGEDQDISIDGSEDGNSS